MSSKSTTHGSKSFHKDSKKASSHSKVEKRANTQVVKKPVLSKTFSASQLKIVKDALSTKEGILRTRAAGMSAYLSDTKTDFKMLEAQMKLQDDTIAMARASMQSALGMKPVRFRLPISQDVNATVTTGVVAAVTAITPTTSSEWAALITLFDEYKVVGFDFRYNVVAPPLTFTAGGNNNASLLVLGYDPVDSTPLTSVRNGCELAKHELIGSVATNGGSSYSFHNYRGSPHKFSVHVPSSVTIASAGGTPLVDEGSWVPTNSGLNQVVWGFMKPYWVSGQVAAVPAISGILELHVDLRCRT